MISPSISYQVSEKGYWQSYLPVKPWYRPELSKFINAYKSVSSRLIKKEHLQIKPKLWKEYFWSWSFCLLTTGGEPVEIVKQYIQSQGNHEKKL